jgi:hypothetical protein
LNINIYLHLDTLFPRMEPSKKPSQITAPASKPPGAGASGGSSGASGGFSGASGVVKSVSGGHRGAFGGGFSESSGALGSDKMTPGGGRAKPQRERSFIKTKVSSGQQQINIRPTARSYELKCSSRQSRAISQNHANVRLPTARVVIKS